MQIVARGEEQPHDTPLILQIPCKKNDGTSKSSLFILYYPARGRCAAGLKPFRLPRAPNVTMWVRETRLEKGFRFVVGFGTLFCE